MGMVLDKASGMTGGGVLALTRMGMARQARSRQMELAPTRTPR